MSEKSSKSKNIIGLIGSVMVIMLAGKLMGFFRDMLITSYLGAGSVESSAYNTASMIPREFLDIVFASAISSSFIPVFNSFLKEKGKEKAFRLASNFINVILAFSVVVTLLAVIISPAITNLIAGEINEPAKLLTVSLLRIMLPTIVLSAVAFCFIGILQSLDEFRIPAAMSVASNLIIIVYYFFFIDKFGVYGLAAAFLLGWLSQIIIQIPSLRKKGYRHSFVFSLKDEGFRQILLLMLPVMVSSWLMPINRLVNYSAATRLFGGSGKGSDTLNYANSLYSVITGILILSISNVVFQMMSKQTIDGDNDAFGTTLRQSLRVLIFLLIPMSAGLIALGRDIISICYEWNNFTAADTELTYQALKFFSVGMLGFGFQTILSRAFYAGRNGKVPLITSVAAIILNAVLSFSLVNVMGVGGPALASSVAISVSAVIMLVIMRRKNRCVMDAKMLIDAIKIIITSLVMGTAAYFINLFIGGAFTDGLAGRLVSLFTSIAVGILIYGVMCYILKISEMRYITDRAFGFLSKARKNSEN